jgi:RNA polymerase sigma factor for flagellar operon FliA
MRNKLSAYESSIKEQQHNLVLQYMPALKAMAFKLKERLPSSIDVNDLISIGTEEMLKLANRYDKEQNDSFWGYGKQRVYGSMLDYLRSLDTVSRSNRKLIKSIEIAINNYFNEYGYEPDDDFLAQKLGEPIEKIREAKSAGEIVSNLPLNEQLTIYSDHNIEERVEQDDLVEKIKNILYTFSKREQLIVQLYYFEELSLKEISSILNISESRISQIHKKLIRKIREEFGALDG